MVTIRRLDEYTPKIAKSVRELLVELSRSGKDKGEISKEWFEDIINSPWHDLLIAEENGELIGMAGLSIMMGPGIQKNAYLEDFVVSSKLRGRGVGGMLWDEIIKWAQRKGAKRLEFTCGDGREAAHMFYHKHGAEIYETDFFRLELSK
ncbi:GNAT family N-acetyltransferase [Candidatus Saccharibacteria bacterium]|jgi:GNAT superfamily N-acetyltransferase|nr:GNAT family N-acetyltransferase [Candidatus Saccharibacteria bacterium]